MRIVVLVSGNGTNLQAIIDQAAAAKIAGEVVAVVSNRADAFGLQRAKQAAIPAVAIEHTAYASRQQYDRALIKEI